MYFAFDLVERILDGDIGAIVFVSIPLAFVIWLVISVYVLPARRWKPPSGPQERTHFYRKKKVTAQKKPPDGGRRGSGGI